MYSLGPEELILADKSLPLRTRLRVRLKRILRFYFSTAFWICAVVVIGIGLGILYLFGVPTYWLWLLEG